MRPILSSTRNGGGNRLNTTNSDQPGILLRDPRCLIPGMVKATDLKQQTLTNQE